MTKPVVLGVGMTKFGKQLDKSFKQLSNLAVNDALKDAQIDKADIEAAFVSNVMAGSVWGQDSIRGQVFLSELGLENIAIHNVENACASGSAAIQMAVMAVTSGMHDVVLVLGTEKMHHQDKTKAFAALKASTDVTENSAVLMGQEKENESVFMNLYAEDMRLHMEQYGTNAETFAKVAAKNSYHGSLNEYAHYRKPNSVQDVMNSRLITSPLRLLMCSPLSDGAAAAIICSEQYAKKHTNELIYIESSVVMSGAKKENETTEVTTVAERAYKQAGIGPSDLGVVEVHDAAVPGELLAYEQLLLCTTGEGGRLIEEKQTYIDGKIPVNPSGGLLSRGHPIGATGIAQLAEINWQLKGEAGKRQIPTQPKTGLMHNVGGYLQGQNASVAIHILSR